MSATFYELLKYAKTGIASPEMTGYDKMKALALFGGSTEQTLTGQPPLTFKSDGTPLISWSMKGNGQQKSPNLFDKSKQPSLIYISDSVQRYGVEIPVAAGKYSCDFGGVNFYIKVKYGTTYGTSFTTSEARTVNLPQDGYILIYSTTQADYATYSASFTLVSGETAPSAYIPYTPTPDNPIMPTFCGKLLGADWTIPLTCAGQTVPVYLGQTQTVRRIKKLVLTGEEAGWEQITDYPNRYFRLNIESSGHALTDIGVSSHFERKSIVSSSSDVGFNIRNINAESYVYIRPVMPENTYNTTSFKAFLTQQYANGTPVTVWYVLAMPETAIVNEPLAKIGDYADELHSEDAGVTIPTAKGQNTLTVETELQPSEVSITGKIKES